MCHVSEKATKSKICCRLNKYIKDIDDFSQVRKPLCLIDNDLVSSQICEGVDRCKLYGFICH